MAKNSDDELKWVSVEGMDMGDLNDVEDRGGMGACGRRAPWNKMARRRVAALGAAVLSFALALGGCAAVGEEAPAQGGSSADSEAASADGSSLDIDLAAMDVAYTDRDKDASYDAGAATTIVLEGQAARVSGEGAAVSGSTVVVSQAGTYVVSGELSDGQLVVDAASDDKVQLVFDGASIHNEDGPAVYVSQADKVFITLADGSENTLSDGAEYVLEDGTDEPYATLFSRDDLTINGQGSLQVTGAYRHAVCSKDDLVIAGGTYVVSAVEDALRGRDCVKILDGAFTLTAGEDAVKSNRDDDGAKGYVCIDGGTFNISAGDDAVHAETALLLNDGVVDVKASYEGLEAEQVYVNGGEVHVTSSDDAVNASARDTVTGNVQKSELEQESTVSEDGAPGVDAAKSDGAQAGMFPMQGFAQEGSDSCLVQINGGYIVLDAGGDGIDSNGSVELNGGVVLVSGPESSADSALDYEIAASVSGGAAIMVGPAGMAQSFSEGTQAFVFASAQGSAGDVVVIVDADGNVCASYIAAKSFQTVVATLPGMAEGETYQVVVGGVLVDAGEVTADGYATAGSIEGGSSVQVVATTTSSGEVGRGEPGGPAGKNAGPGGEGGFGDPGDDGGLERPEDAGGPAGGGERGRRQ